MRRKRRWFAHDLCIGAAITSALLAFWLLFIESTPEDVAALVQMASHSRKASAYLVSVLNEVGLPSRGQLILAQANVVEMMNSESVQESASSFHFTFFWQACASLLALHVCVSLALALCLQHLRRLDESR